MVIDEWCERIWGIGSLGVSLDEGWNAMLGERWEAIGRREEMNFEVGWDWRQEEEGEVRGYKSREMVMCSCTFCLEAVSVWVSK